METLPAGEAIDFALRKVLYYNNGEKRTNFEIINSAMWPLFEMNSFEDLASWKKERNTAVLAQTNIIIPIFVKDHWMIGIISTFQSSNPVVRLYDSKHQERPSQVQLLFKIAKFLTRKQAIYTKLTGPYQNDGYNCGPFTILAVKYLSTTSWQTPLLKFNLEDVTQLRKNLVSDIENSIAQVSTISIVTSPNISVDTNGQFSISQKNVVRSEEEQISTSQDQNIFLQEHSYFLNQTNTQEHISHKSSVDLSSADFQSLKKLSLFEGLIIQTIENIKLYTFHQSEITNQLVYELLCLKEEQLLTKKDIAIVISSSLGIDPSWIDKKFVNRILHGNYISTFIKEFASEKLSKSETNKRIFDLSVGGILYDPKYTKVCPKPHVEIESNVKNNNESCSNCLKKTELYFCRSCYVIKYCSTKCLSNDLKKHRPFCLIKQEKLKSSSIPSPESSVFSDSFDRNLLEEKVNYQKKIEYFENLVESLNLEILSLNKKLVESKTLLNEVIKKKTVPDNFTTPKLANVNLKKSTSSKKILALKKRQLRHRVLEVQKCMIKNAGCGEEIDEKVIAPNMAKLVSELIKSKPKLFSLALKNHPKLLKITHQLTPKEASLVHGGTFRTWSARRKCVSALKKVLHFNPYGSEDKQRKYEKEQIPFLDENLITGNLLLSKTAKSSAPTLEPFACVRSLKAYIEHIIDEAVDAGKLDFDSDLFKTNMQGKIWIVLSADHGGDLKVSSSMKFCVQILDWKICPYGIYEASDILENQWAFHARYYEELQTLVSSGVQVQNRNVQILLFQKGDMKQAFEFLGLGGQSSTFPSRYSLTKLEHLRNDHSNGQPHGPSYCNVDELRTMETISEQYFKNKKDNPHDLRVNAKNYQSVINKPLIPLVSPLMSVPNILHYKLALVLEGHTQIVKKLRSDQGNTSLIVEEKEEQQSLQLQELEKLKSDESALVNKIIEKNILLKRLLAHTKKKDLEVIARSEKNLTRPDPKFKRWTFPWSCTHCLLTKYDSNILWSQCDKCLKYFHPYCLAEIDQELGLKTTISSILCSGCQGSKDLSAIIEEHKMEKKSMDSEYNSIKMKVSELSRAAESLRSEVDMYTTESEHLYRKQLKMVNIDLQMYHGGTMVVNHCDIYLDNYESLTTFIADENTKNFFNNYFYIIKRIIRKCQSKIWLNESDICEITQFCHQLGEEWPKLSRTVTTKVDDVVFHLPRFIKEFKTLGFLSEEDTESLHKDMNVILRPLSCIRSKPLKLKLGLKRLALKKSHDESNPDFLKPTKRRKLFP